MIKTCICGRVGEHCPNADCGSISKTPLKQRTIFMSRQLGLDIRYYTCRKCGVEYAWLNGSLYDGKCYAPKEIRLVATPQNIEQEIKDLNEAIQFIRSRGGIVDFPNGIKEPDQVLAEQEKEELIIEKAPGLIIERVPRESEPELVIQKITNGSMDELPPGWSYNDKGQKVGPLSMDDLFKKKETPKDESNS
jgi:hypothetical protein